MGIPPFYRVCWNQTILMRRFAHSVILVAALLLACLATWAISWQQGIVRLREHAAAGVDRVQVNLTSALDRYAILPYLLASHPYVQDSLDPGGAADALPRRAEDTAQAIQRTNLFLQRVNQEAQASATYVIDAAGNCIAASNWQRPVSFVGRRYLFRPYFRDAIDGGAGRFFGIGTSAAEPGYFVSQPVRAHDGRIIGVAVVKLDLEWFQRSDAGEPLIVTDNHGVIFLSSEPAWKYHTLTPLSAGVAAAVDASRQYAQQRLSPLRIVTEHVLAADARIVRVGERGHAARYLATTRQLAEPHWQLTTFTSLEPVVWSANYATAITAFSGLCLFLLRFYLRMRRARIQDMIRSGALLRTAYAELNQRVDERTADLSAANTLLQTEVRERTRAEQELRAAHRELVQASKLAALGQMAAGITHELNQPLAALRTFSDNTRILLQRGERDAAAENLEAIASLTDRMGRITNQLKLFIGKARPRDVRTPVPRAIANALTVLDSRLHTVALGVWYDPVSRLDDAPADAAMAAAAGQPRGASPVSQGSGPNGAAPSGQRILPDAELALARAQRLPIDPETMPHTPAVWCDQLRLEQLLINVIGNAADALRARAQPRIDLLVSTTPSCVTVTVLDNGPGMSADVLAHLFEPFFTTKESGEGLGLGLAISAAIASEYGGTLRAANRTTPVTAAPASDAVANAAGAVRPTAGADSADDADDAEDTIHANDAHGRIRKAEADPARGAAPAASGAMFVLTLRRADGAARQSLLRAP
ncbi:MAG: sensor histidine kinase [Janthinobacterium lividum]